MAAGVRRTTIQSIHSVGDFCEGNGWHYTFFVPQHPEGLIELMGGDAPFISKLDSLFLVEGELGENASPGYQWLDRHVRPWK